MMSSTVSFDRRIASSPSWHISPDFVPGLVSVIVPTYNRRNLVLDSLESVVDQTYRPIELIVVDDGSSDGTAEVVENWFISLAEDRVKGIQFRVIRQENGGLSRARNHGLAASHGEFIQFLDSDDLLHPSKLQVQVSRLQTEPSLAFVYSSHLSFTSMPNWSISATEDQRWNRGVAHLAELNPIQGIARRWVFLDVGLWNERISYREDVEFYMQMHLAGIKSSFVPGVYAAGRTHTGARLTTKASPALGLDALRAVADLVNASGTHDAATAEFMATQFFRTGFGAVAQGEVGVAREAARWGLRYPCSKARRWKLRALAALSARVVPDIVRRKTIEGMLKFVRRQS